MVGAVMEVLNQSNRAILVTLLLAILALQPAAAQEETPPGGAAARQEIEAQGAWILALSPDGSSFVAADGRERRRLCVHTVATLSERACGDLEARNISLFPDSVVWSPDSTRVAFAEDTRRDFTDGDLWVMDAATGELTNLTDDGFDGTLPLDDEESDTPVYVDSFPAWAPDGRSIAFSRTTASAGGFMGDQIVRLDLASGEVETLVSVSPDEWPVVYFRVAWAPDGQRLYYSLTFPDADHPDNGVWVYDVGAQTTTRILTRDPEKGSAALIHVAATGQTALILYPDVMRRFLGQRDYYALLDLETNRLAPVHSVAPDPASPAIAAVATFSPDGTQVLYALQRHDDGMIRLLVRQLPEGQPEAVAADLDGPFAPTTFGGGLFWADSGTVFLATGVDAGLLFHLEPEPASWQGSVT